MLAAFRLCRISRVRLAPHATRSLLRGFSDVPAQDVRKQLTTELKNAMKSKDTVKSTTIRSVLSEVYSADKTQDQPLPSGSIVSIIRKAVARRLDAASEFDRASRPELAAKERTEADVLQAFVPPLLPVSQIDNTLQQIIDELKPAPGDKKALGQVFKAFYGKVDRSVVDAALVKSRAEALLSQ